MEDYLEKYKQEIVSEIREVLDRHFQQFGQEILFGEELKPYLMQYTTSGKCVRGLNVLAFYFDKTITRDAFKVAAAMELFHSGLLVHDDIMDLDNMRRGLPSVHRFYQNLDQKISDHDAHALAMCVGDVLFFLAYELLGEVTEHAGEVARIMSQEMIRVGYAQQKDVHFGMQEVVSEEAVLKMYSDKTAGYTFSLPFILGNTLSGKRYENTQLQDLGQKLGIVFQIMDDCLEVFSSEGEIGKSVMSDLSNGKKTLYMMLLHEKASVEDQVFIQALLETKDVSNGRFDILQNLLKKYAIRETVMEYISSYKSDILKQIEEQFVADMHLHKYMDFLVNYIIDRRM